MGIGIAHRPESTIRHLFMRPKALLPRSETTNVIYRFQCNFCAVNYIGETGKRLQTRVGGHMRVVRRMGPLSLVVDHCADSGHTFAFQNAEILGRESDCVARETIEAWHTVTTSINCCVTLPTAYHALRTQLNDRKSQREHGPNVHPNMGESMADTHAIATQPRPDERTVIASASSTTYPAGANTHGGSIATKINSLGRQLRSMGVLTTTANVRTPTPDQIENKPSPALHQSTTDSVNKQRMIAKNETPPCSSSSMMTEDLHPQPGPSSTQIQKP
ncbi:unnamed protein product [Schistocephalus solidus]|uniref:GIY-YIG domain-containing protein n=1 Tax=Schistocephalus solidus TaxID=70667 RepID=A0A183T837_SCHSO|nr:unnamed protein product [Schistocephalus solidus]